MPPNRPLITDHCSTGSTGATPPSPYSTERSPAAISEHPDRHPILRISWLFGSRLLPSLQNHVGLNQLSRFPTLKTVKQRHRRYRPPGSFAATVHCHPVPKAPHPPTDHRAASLPPSTPDFSPSFRGREIRNVVPWPTVLSTEIRPPWASTTVLHWNMPIPSPWVFVVWKG